MTSLLTYSGITTKVKAMEGKLIKKSEFDEMAQMDSVSEVVELLRKKNSYRDILSRIENNDLHRGVIEEFLTLSLYHDFTRIYRFCNLKQRKFLDLYFIHYDIVVLKKCLRNVASAQPFNADLSIFQDFFEYHSTFDINKIAASSNIEEFFTNLEGSRYYALIKHLRDSGSTDLFEYEMQFDQYYFHSIWNINSKYLSKTEQEILKKCYGSTLDLLNIQWIYRSKKYYQLNSADIYALLISITYRLTKKEITALVESATLEDFYAILQTTYYGSLTSADLSIAPDLERLYEQVLNHVYKQTSKKAPYSIAILNSYLYFKEIEIQKIITIIEGIRYGLSAEVINSYVIRI